jgi:hypothetical protein|mmetsp:Transcript_4913/g.14243  ORF Transcript_4913/g.14243 Transcript_4913/m.14243 type:complete len:222 (-) Transcript_4913:2030-2695(-)
MDAEVRNLIDTLARHAAASSTGVQSFVAFVAANQRGNPLFAFLDEGHHHHADWLDALAQEHAKLNVAVDQAPAAAIVSIPTRLIPAVVEDNLRWSDPYTPADATSIEMASKSTLPVKMDEYLELRLKCFDEDLMLYESRPGVSYSDVRPESGPPRAEVAGKEREPAAAFESAARAPDGRFHGGSKVKGLGFERSKAGKTEAALEGYRSMKKRGQSYGKLKK